MSYSIYEGGSSGGGANGTNGADGKTILNGSGVPASGLGVDGDFYIDITNADIYGPKTGGAWGAATSIIGPQGIQGIQGEQGIQGIQGSTGNDGNDGNDGADGQTILNGSGLPAGGTGADGDFYIDTTNADIYGPKTGGAWGAATSIIGPQGIQGIQGEQGIQGIQGSTGNDGNDGNDGADGQTILNGSGVPGGGTGADGDFYIDTTNADIYGPKTGGAWGSATSIIGPQGAQGIQGIQGEQGIQGIQGIQGSTGNDGNDGADGQTILNGSGVPGGGTGIDGDFYIDTTNADIYGPKTGGAWGSATSIIGPQGIQGTAGNDGNDGNDGADGKTVLNGDGVPAGGTGSDGDFYIDTTNNDIYGPKTGGAWGSATSLIGPAGAGGGSSIEFIYLHSDMTVDDTTQEVITDGTRTFSIPVTAGKNYWFSARLHITSSTGSNHLRSRVEPPSGTTGWVFSMNVENAQDSAYSLSVPATTLFVPAPASATFSEITGTAFVTTTGTIEVRIANDSGTTAQTIGAGSILQYVELPD